MWSIWFCLLGSALQAQTDELNQLWNEYSFINDLNKKWQLEFDTGLVTSSTAYDDNAFYGVTQFYLRSWAHYYPDERWKLSAFFAHYSNKNVPELNQAKTREFRAAFQAVYSVINSDDFKMNLRVRAEDRHLQNGNGTMEAVGRFRFQIKAVYPLKSNTSAVGKFFVFASEELVFKSKSQVSGPDLFDRNRVSLGIGWKIGKDFQVETDYINEIMPREGADKLVNALRVRVIFKNVFSNFAETYKSKKNVIDEEQSAL